jgi:hypothetical protein
LNLLQIIEKDELTIMENIRMNEAELKQLWIENEIEKTPKGKIKFKHQAIQNTVNKMYNRFKEVTSYDEIISLALELAVDTVSKFEIRNGKTFEDVIAGDKELNGKLHKNINLVLKNRLQHVDDKAFYTFENASKRHVVIKPTMASIDVSLTDETGNEMLVIETLENGYWDVKEGYKKSHFIEWFLERREEFLTKKQNEFIDSYINGVEQKRKSGYIDRIGERAVREYESEFGIKVEKEPSYLERQIQRKLGLWNSLLSIVEDDMELELQNDRISDWFIKNLSKEEVSNLVGDNLTGKEYRRVMYAVTASDIGVKIPAKVLYKLIECVYKRIDGLKAIETSQGVPFYKKNSECGNWTRESHDNYYSKSLKEKQQPTYVYDREGDLKEVIPHKPYRTNKTIIKNLMPTGVSVEITGE